MRRLSPKLAGATLMAALAAGAPLPAAAQSDPATLRLIEQLTPRTGGATRGIRLPAPADSGTPATPAATTPATPAAETPPTQAQPIQTQPIQAQPIQAQPIQAQPIQTQPVQTQPVQAPVPQPLPPAETATTAPPGVAAVSITVTFPSGSAALTPQAEATLAPLGRALSSPALAPFRFRIEGHTDSVGDAGSNMRLSERRAQSVRDYLVIRHGVAPGRLDAIGLGETRLLVPTGDGVDDARNRRVQVVNLAD
jgi:outer membrane protein OmpA-like peptidoglycan-associated protein